MTASNVRALVVEDDRSWQRILSEILTDVGLLVDVADSLEDALAILREKSHRVAVVDLSLAGSDHHNRDGLHVLDAVRRLDPDCATVLLTGYATVELAVDVLKEHGAFTCLRKETFRRREFREMIGRALASAPRSAALGTSSLEGESETGRKGQPEETAGRNATPNVALVVDDDAGWRNILAELLADAGYQVLLASSYGEALGLLRRERCSLAVVDLSLRPV